MTDNLTNDKISMMHSILDKELENLQKSSNNAFSHKK